MFKLATLVAVFLSIAPHQAQNLTIDFNVMARNSSAQFLASDNTALGAIPLVRVAEIQLAERAVKPALRNWMHQSPEYRQDLVGGYIALTRGEFGSNASVLFHPQYVSQETVSTQFPDADLKELVEWQRKAVSDGHAFAPDGEDLVLFPLPIFSVTFSDDGTAMVTTLSAP